VGLGLLAPPLAAQRTAPHATFVYGIGKEPTMPIPILMGTDEANSDLSDQLFLHLVTFAPGLHVTGDNALAPSLAKSWRRIDPLTMVFEIDPRARWQDGAPVTAHDVVYTWKLANDPKVSTDMARLNLIASVEATAERTVRVHFKAASAEQVYVFGFLIQPLPSHLLEKMAPDAIATSEFAKKPIGDGPYVYTRHVPGQLVELTADSTFFLGRPTISRVLFRVATDPNLRVSMFLDGESDVLDNIPPQSLTQVQQHAGTRLTDVPSNVIVYLLFNTHAPGDSTKPHPLFADPRVREALMLALDRNSDATATFGVNARVPDAAQSQLWGWITPGGIVGQPSNVARARALLAAAGWRDNDGDGILDRNGTPFHFRITYGNTTEFRHVLAQKVQQQWRAIGVDAEIDRVDVPTLRQRILSGQWDLYNTSAKQDPTPSSLVQSWSCESAHQTGTSNFAHWCDPTFDKLVSAALAAKDQPAAWRAAYARMSTERPAIFMAAPANTIAVHTRFDNAIIWPSHSWLSIWQWRVRPEAALPRDR
jgi:peptide/nickel transport system substrate-binding protein